MRLNKSLLPVEISGHLICNKLGRVNATQPHQETLRKQSRDLIATFNYDVLKEAIEKRIILLNMREYTKSHVKMAQKSK